MRGCVSLCALLTGCAELLAGQATAAPANTGYYRHPSVRGSTIAFAAEGDIWTVPVSGGAATRLTTHPGPESQPSISPDGETIAFLANYEDGGAGQREAGEVYTMPIGGGLPVRRTWAGPANARTSFVGWTPDGRLLYGTREYASLPSVQLVTQDIKSGTVTRIALSEADQGAYTADGKSLVFTRMPFQGSFTRRYKGGFIQQLWRFDDAAGEAAPLTTDFEGTSKDAMVIGGRVYFASDRDAKAATMNIWSMDLSGKDLRQHTFHDDFEVQYPEGDGTGAGQGRIVYQCGADIWLLDLGTGQSSRVNITLPSDFDQRREYWLRKPAAAIESVAVSPDGDRVSFVARGRVFVSPTKQGRLVEVAREQGVRNRATAFVPRPQGEDPKAPGDLLVISDRSGETEFWTVPAEGPSAERAGAEQVTSGAQTLRWEGVPSPDGTMFAHHDKKQQLWVTTIADKQTKLVATARVDAFADLAWSADSQWLAYVEQSDANFNRQIKLYNVKSGVSVMATTDRFESFSPAFSADGHWLYFLSDRSISSSVPSPWGPMNPMPVYDKRTKVYMLALKPGLRSPWVAADEVYTAEQARKKAKEKRDEEDKKSKSADNQPVVAAEGAVKAEPKGDTQPTGKGDGAKGSAKPVEIVTDGLSERLMETPIPAGNYQKLRVNDKAVFYSATAWLYDNPGQAEVRAVAIGNEKVDVKTVASGVRSFELSLDGKKMFVHKGETISVVDAAVASADLEKGAVELSGLSIAVEPGREWRQMYADAWRMLRDYFYATNMHGADWPRVRDKYAPLLDRIASRSDLADVLAQMTAELSALHHFVYGGDLRTAPQHDRSALGHLGGELTRDEAAGGWRIESVYEFDADEPSQTPPLARPSVAAKAGEVITHINGISSLSVAHPAVLLRNTVGRQVLLKIKGVDGASRDVIAVPVSTAEAANLRYNQWELQRRLLVERASESQIGYVHLRAMGTSDIAQWAKNFYPVFSRQGLIIDVRRNNGGNIDSWILSTLLRKSWMYWNQHAGRAPAWNMQMAFRGHVVVICDAFTASDGEAFSDGFRRLGLGKVIGMRTWGGEIWLSSSNRLVDDGLATAGEYGVFAEALEGPEKGKYVWIVEGRGVEPDLVVDNPPHATFKGQDAQLDAAIAHLKQLIKERPVVVPAVPPFPDKQHRP